jgi:diguanylate cyclase (GGDEF)-like protein
MFRLNALRAPLTTEELRRLRAYDRVGATADVIILSVVVFFLYFLPTPLFRELEIYSLAVILAIFSLFWHAVFFNRFLGRGKLFTKNLIDTIGATLLIQFSGEEQSPFFFLYFLILLAVAVAVGVRHTLVMAGLISLAYMTAVGVSFERLVQDPRAFVYIWMNVISLWVVGYLAALLADEAEKARREVLDAKTKVERYSKIDWLTGLFNMRHFEVLAAQELARADRYGRTLSLIMLDSDRLKTVNDTYGHQKGDQLISELAQTITREVRMSDTVIRYGGDEFVVLMPETDDVGARYLAERIRAAVEENPLAVDGGTVTTTISLGVASYPKDALDAMSLLACADAALRYSKETGRNRVSDYIRGMEGRDNGLAQLAEAQPERRATEQAS